MEDLFEIIVPVLLVYALGIAVVITPFSMALVQRIKELPIISEGWQVWVVNLLASSVVGFFMSIVFWDINKLMGGFIAFFVFLGAPALYEGLKNYTPKSLKDTPTLKNKIKLDLTEGDE